MIKLEACWVYLRQISLKRDHTYYTWCLVKVLGILELGVRQWNHCYEDITSQGSERDSKSISL